MKTLDFQTFFLAGVTLGHRVTGGMHLVLSQVTPFPWWERVSVITYTH